MNPQVENAQKAIAALARDEPWPERLTEVRRLLTLIRDHSAGMDETIVEILNDTLDPNLTPKEQEKAFVDVIITVIALVPSYP
jgi:hypothetical protein